MIEKAHFVCCIITQTSFLPILCHVKDLRGNAQEKKKKPYDADPHAQGRGFLVIFGLGAIMPLRIGKTDNCGSGK